MSHNGCAVYDVAAPEHHIELTAETVDVERASTLTTAAGDRVVLFGVEEATRWSVRPS